MPIKNRNDRVWLAVNTETGEPDYAYVREACSSDCEWGEHARATDHRLIHGWEFRPFMIVPDTETSVSWGGVMQPSPVKPEDDSFYVDDGEGEDKCANWKPLGDESDAVAGTG